jgi:hypothetical protein
MTNDELRIADKKNVIATPPLTEEVVGTEHCSVLTIHVRDG